MKVTVRDSPGAKVKGTASAPFQVRPIGLGVESAALLSRPSSAKSAQKARRSSHWVR